MLAKATSPAMLVIYYPCCIQHWFGSSFCFILEKSHVLGMWRNSEGYTVAYKTQSGNDCGRLAHRLLKPLITHVNTKCNFWFFSGLRWTPGINMAKVMHFSKLKKKRISVEMALILHFPNIWKAEQIETDASLHSYYRTVALLTSVPNTCYITLRLDWKISIRKKKKCDLM